MANTFLTPSVIGREALMILENNLVATSLFNRGQTATFTGAKVGDTISIRKPASFTAQEFSSTTTTQNATETSTSMVLEKHFDVTFAVTSKDWTLELEDFSRQLIEPAVVAIAQGIDAYIMGKYTGIETTVGTAGDPPDSLADLAAVDKELNDQTVPVTDRICSVSSQAKADMLGISAVVQAEQRGDGGRALREASLGRVMGIDWYMSQNVQTHDGNSPSSWLINSASVAIGDTSVAIDGGSGNPIVGDVFVVAGDTQEYVVSAVTGSSPITFSPAAKVAWADNAALTFVGDHVANIAGHPSGLTVAIVPLELPAGAARAEYISDRNLGIRVVYDYSTSTKTDTISLDVLCGAKVQQPDLLTRVLG